MTRFAIIERADMNEEQARIYDDVEAEGGPLGGPYWAYIRHPKLMRQVQDLSNCLRAGPLSARERQIAVLAIARHWGANYPWAAQVRASLAAGVEQDIIDAINAGQTPDLTDAREKAAHDVAVELLADHGLGDATHAAAEAALGLEDLIAVVATVGQFSMTCCTANAFDITPPDGAARLLPR